MPAQSSRSSDARISQWAAGAGKLSDTTGFAARLNGAQVEAELRDLFRELPEFGRALATRLARFVDASASGPLTLIGGGGEAAVFFDEDSQQVVKFFGSPGPAAFGWVVARTREGSWTLRGGTLAGALLRFAWFEELFPTALELDEIDQDGRFLVLRQPFILGRHPDALTLRLWMERQGWAQHVPPTDLPMLRNLTWCRGGFIATDVRPENALVAESDGELRAIDFVIAREDELLAD
jgi:hypothetical protein